MMKPYIGKMRAQADLAEDQYGSAGEGIGDFNSTTMKVYRTKLSSHQRLV